MTPTIFIIILNWNGKKNTLQCLESIKHLQTWDLELKTIVVDNGSEEELRIENSELRMIKLIRNKENLGFAGGNNVGIKYALENGADYILILNNDTLVDSSLVEELLEVAAQGEHIGIVAPKIYFVKGYEFHKDRYKEPEREKVFWYAGGIMDWANVIGKHRGVDEVDWGQYDTVEETDFASGCCMFIRREVIEKIGMFDEKYFLYYEDSDLCEKTKRAGFKIMYAPKAFLWHKNAGSVGGSGSMLQDYYITRNRMRFGMRYASFRAKIALIRESINLLFKGRQWQRLGVLDFYRQRFGKGMHDF